MVVDCTFLKCRGPAGIENVSADEGEQDPHRPGGCLAGGLGPPAILLVHVR